MPRPVLKPRLSSIVTAVLVGILSLINGVVALQAREVTLELLPSPAPANSSLSRLVSDESGLLYLSWVSQAEGVASLSYSALTNDGWTEPKIVSQGSDWFINWADFPALSVNAGNMTAHWLRKSAQGTYDYNIEARFYDKKNQNWSADTLIHKDGISAEHGFVSMLPVGPGQTMITWLDGRETAAENNPGAMTLRAGIFDASGITLNEWELDHRVCDCCQTSSAMTNKGPIVVYRNRSEDEIRDIYMTRYVNDVWSTPRAIHNDNWQIAGCPVNGPAIAAKNEQVAVSWFMAKDDTPKVQLVISTDGGDSFSQPILVASPNTNGRVGTVILDSGDIVVSWLDTALAAAKLTLTRYSAKGMLLDSTVVATTSASRRSGFPIIEGLGDSVYVTWTDISEAPRVKVARLSY